MSTSNEKLDAIKQSLSNGLVPPSETVRDFVSWFGSTRRGWRVCSEIRSKLSEYSIKTVPDFEYVHIDGSIRFSTNKPDESLDAGEAVADPTHRLGRFSAVNKTPVHVKPDASVAEAITLMLARDYSQLPVMQNEKVVKGMVSWKTIGSRLSLGKEIEFVRDCMEPAQVVSQECSLFAAIDIIAEHDYVLVRASDHAISGIITASDLNHQFRLLAEPFLLLGEIENGIRQLIHGKYEQSELEAVKAPGDDDRSIEGINNLTFGEYIRLLENDERWKKLKIRLDRVCFIKSLNDVREIRNDVMHFNPDGLSKTSISILREFAQLLSSLRAVGAA